MLKVLTAEQMREVDRLTTERYGIPSIILMENAAHAVARVITEKLGGSVTGKSILILCGKGNNGGDGAALARILWQQGASCLVVLVGLIEDTEGDARANFELAKQISVTQTGSFNTATPYLGILEVTTDEQIWNLFSSVEEDVCVDALLGTGFSGRLRGNYPELIKPLNNFRHEGRKSLIVSIDLPSGVNSDNGELDVDVRDGLVESHLRAVVSLPTVTVTFTAPKIGNVLPPASRCSKELVVAQIGSASKLIDEVPSLLFLAEALDTSKWLKSARYYENSYKTKRGHALVIAGSEDYSGAAVLAGNAAMRSGAGLVTLAVPKAVKSEVAARALPDLIVRPFDDGEFDVKADAVLIGCGLDSGDSANEALFHKIVDERTSPVIVDAGALAFVPARTDKSVGAPLILTPHEGEFSRLLDAQRENHPVDEASPPLLGKEGSLKEDRVAAVRDYATANNVILVLKGERVLIGAPDGRVVVNPTGNSGLGKAGNGDTLAGILVGFVAQGAKMEIDIFETVVAAVYIAGMAGDVAEKKYGKRVMTASDVRDCLVDVFAELEHS